MKLIFNCCLKLGEFEYKFTKLQKLGKQNYLNIKSVNKNNSLTKQKLYLQIMFSKLQFLDAVKNPLQKIKSSFKQIIGIQKIQTIQIIPYKLYHISTPCSQNIQSLLELLNSGHQFQLWNIGEYSYNEEILSKLLESRERNSDGRQTVYNLTYEYFANIPFCEMIKSIEIIQTFLALSPNNRVFIHCQDNKRRSAVFLACYIFLTGIETDFAKSILTVNKLLNLSIEDKKVCQGASGTIYKSQHLVLKNLMNYINNSSFINKNAWNLKKILINNAPKIQMVLKMDNLIKQVQNSIKYKVLLEIRSAEGIIYKKIFQDQFIEGQSLCLRIPQSEEIVLKDDFLIIIKYVHLKKGYSIIRSQLNTNFIYDPYFRVQRDDMDLSSNSTEHQNQTFFMDLILQPNVKELSELSQLKILKQNNEDCGQTNTQQKQTNSKILQVQIERTNAQKHHQEEQQEDGFRILNQEEEAEHNQKMQRQIQEELARQLQNIRKKKTQESQKVQQHPHSDHLLSQNTQLSENLFKAENKDKNHPQVQKIPVFEDSPQKMDQKQQKDFTETQTQHNAQKKSGKKQQESKPESQIEKKDQQNQEQSQQGSDQQSSSAESSSEQEGHEQEQDLDDYLTKLESQAEKR